jgi:uncharacterized membrane protein YeiB
MSKRIISLDIIRGWAILGNLLVHFFMITSEVQGLAEGGQLDQLDASGFIFMGFIVIFGHWRGLFLLISAAIHWYIMKRKLDAGVPRNVILRQELLKGLMLFIWAMIFYLFLAEWGLSNQWANINDPTVDFNWKQIYHVDQFTNIAAAIFITAFVFYFWSKNEKRRKPLIATAVFVILGLAFIIPAPYALDAANNFWGVEFQHSGGMQNLGEKGWWDYIVRFITNQFVSRESPLMPHYGYSATGAIIGIFISGKEKINKKKFLGWGYGIAGFSIIFGVFWFLVINKALTLPTDDIIKLTADFHIHPTWYVFVTIGFLLIVVLSLFASIEFNRKLNVKRRLRISRLSRRAGVMSLSVYSLASIQVFLRVGMWGIFRAFGSTKADMFRTNLGLPTGWVVFMWILELGLWFFILWIWEKGRYIGSPDWLFAVILKGPTKMKEEKHWAFKDPLDIKNKIIEPEIVQWVTPIADIEEDIIDDSFELPSLQEEEPKPQL